MSDLIKLNLDENDSILIELPTDTSKIRPMGREDSVLTKIEKSFDNMIKSFVTKICKSFNNSFLSIEDKQIIPDKATIEFGLQFNIEGNIYLVKTSGQSSIKVTFEWTNKK
jgi:hypothetical protein